MASQWLYAATVALVVLAPPAGAGEAADRIPTRVVKAYLSFLADDALEGRRTGERGHEIAAAYLGAQLASFGAVGGAADGSFFQEVPLVRTRVDAAGSRLVIGHPGPDRPLVYGTDYALMDTHAAMEDEGMGRVVFVGYGITAPEQGWDDYAGIDVKGCVVAYLELEGPPSFPPTVRAYYQDHDVRRAMAAAHGAVGALAILTPEVQGRFPWSFLLRELDIGWNSLRWLHGDGTPAGLGDGLHFMAMLNRSGAEALFAGETPSLDDVYAAARAGHPPVFALKDRAVRVQWRARHEPVKSRNVIGVFPGSDPVLKDEVVLYTAHADHLGIGPAVDGDAIYNGAMDNAAGCAVLLAIARAIGESPTRPARSVMFAFVTGEEAGLLGSDYLAQHPPVPKARLVADINVDGGISLVSVDDVLAWGGEHSTLGAVVGQVAARTGLTVSPDPFPEEGLFVRSDQFSLIKQGVPSLFVDVGIHSTDSAIDALAVLKHWMVTDYHSPRDDLKQPLQYETSARFAGFVLAVGEIVANAPERPRWNPGDFFGQRFGAAR